LLNFLRITCRTVAFLLGTLVCWLLFEASLLLAGKRRYLQIVNRWVPRWARLSLWIFRVRVTSQGQQQNTGQLFPGKGTNGIGRIFISNHQSTLDIPILLTLTESHIISRHDLAKWPIIGIGARRVGTLFVDRTSRRSGADVLREVSRVLENGEGVAMFPEGTTYPGDGVHPFHNGAFNTARRTGAELVPIGIAYDNPEVYYFEEPLLQHMKRVFSIRQVRVAVEIGEPLSMNGASSVEMKEKAQQQVQALVQSAQRKLEENKG